MSILADIAHDLHAGKPPRVIADRERNVSRFLFGRLDPLSLAEYELSGDVVQDTTELMQRVGGNRHGLVRRQFCNLDIDEVASKLLLVVHENAILVCIRSGLQQFFQLRQMFTATCEACASVAER